MDSELEEALSRKHYCMNHRERPGVKSTARTTGGRLGGWGQRKESVRRRQSRKEEDKGTGKRAAMGWEAHRCIRGPGYGAPQGAPGACYALPVAEAPPPALPARPTAAPGTPHPRHTQGTTHRSTPHLLIPSHECSHCRCESFLAWASCRKALTPAPTNDYGNWKGAL